MWQEIGAGIQQEFADLPNATQTTRLIVRSFIGCILGGLIGFERERSGKDAGIRTHMLVCVGTAFFVAIPELAGFTDESLSRIIQGLAAGIGFLGAGAILKHEDEGKVEGLTTAASVWLTAAIGIAVGIGSEASAVLGAVLAVVILGVLPKFQK